MGLLSALLLLRGCTALHLAWFMTTARALPAQSSKHRDGATSLFYRCDTAPHPDVVWFFVGGSGCPSRKAVMPDYLTGVWRTVVRWLAEYAAAAL